jgi:hypothetical protein
MNQTELMEDEVVRNLLTLIDVSGAKRNQLARFAGKDPSVITDRMKGAATITVPDLRVYADFFNIRPNVFFFTEDEMKAWLTPEQTRALKERVLLDIDANVVSIHARRGRPTRHAKAGLNSGNDVCPCEHDSPVAA